MDEIPNSARSTNMDGKRYAELHVLDNSVSIRRDLQTIQKSDF